MPDATRAAARVGLFDLVDPEPAGRLPSEKGDSPLTCHQLRQLPWRLARAGGVGLAHRKTLRDSTCDRANFVHFARQMTRDRVQFVHFAEASARDRPAAPSAGASAKAD
jgi:hypothetical protein